MLVGGFGCSAIGLCWLVMKVVAFLWAWWKSGVIVSGECPRWIKRVKNSCDFFWMSRLSEHRRWRRRMWPKMRPLMIPDGWAEWGGM